MTGWASKAKLRQFPDKSFWIWRTNYFSLSPFAPITGGSLCVKKSEFHCIGLELVNIEMHAAITSKKKITWHVFELLTLWKLCWGLSRRAWTAKCVPNWEQCFFWLELCLFLYISRIIGLGLGPVWPTVFVIWVHLCPCEWSFGFLDGGGCVFHVSLNKPVMFE